MLIIIDQCHSCPVLVKLLKKLFMIDFNDLVHDLENNNIFYKYQFRFRANHSGNHVLTEIIEQARNACGKGLYTCSVYLDLQKTFDTVNQNIGFNTLQ